DITAPDPGGMPGDAPDVYYLVLDGYAREDVLREFFGYDDAPFLGQLEDMGFYVAREARNNYPLSSLSFASSLNYRYLEELAASVGRDSMRSEAAHALIRENHLMSNVDAFGYRIVHFNSGWWPTEHSPLADVCHGFCRLGDQFPSALLGYTPLGGLSEMASRGRIIKTFEELPAAVSDDDGPTFVFAHVMVPHPPYLLDRDGEALEGGGLHVPREVGEDADKYLEAVRFANRSVLRVVQEILSREDRPDPIIILTSDHGTSSTADGGPSGWNNPSDELIWERSSILSAYRVPRRMEKRLYPGITPINGVRLLLSECFGADLPLLEDRVFFSSYLRPYDWSDVTGVSPHKRD
ncbi:MAG: sulfatase-like hydrolase/transferase, partial [Clostridia bacterium]